MDLDWLNLPYKTREEEEKKYGDRKVRVICQSTSLTSSDLILLIERINNILLHTEEGMSQALDRCFSDQAPSRGRRGIPLGTLRVYSDELMCFWDGKNWRKITLAEAKRPC